MKIMEHGDGSKAPYIAMPPYGQGWNYKLSVTVASNNLTVAIKGADGNDPSATNPVTFNIGGTERILTSALSVTAAAATNWCNAGAAELATLEQDYFTYIGYNATDGIVLGFSRYPGMNQYGDFSATSTNEKFCKISTITTAASTDPYHVIGRFAATLSAGAGYTWTVPTFTPANLIHGPIYDSRWMSWTPTIAVSGGTAPTYTTQTCRYRFSGKTWGYTFLVSNSSGGTAGAGSNQVTASLPITLFSSGGRECLGNGFSSEASGTRQSVTVFPLTSTTIYFIYAGTVTIKGDDQSSADRFINCSGFYEI